MPKLFTWAGTSVDSEGYSNYRMAMDPESRTKMLDYNGHTEIEFLKLPRPMLRPDAIAWLNKQGIDIGEEVATDVEVETEVVINLTPAKQRLFDAAQAELAAAQKAAERAKAKLDRIAA